MIDVSDLPRHQLCEVCLDRGCADGGTDRCGLTPVVHFPGVGPVHVGRCTEIAGRHVKAERDDEEQTAETPLAVAADLLRTCKSALVLAVLESAVRS